MADESDGVEETFDAALRVGLTVAGQLAERLARQVEQSARQAQAMSEAQAAEMASRLQAERTVAAAVGTQVSQADWWENASPRDVSDAWERAWVWAQMDDGAREAAKTIRGQSVERFGVDPTDPRAEDLAVREALRERGVQTDLPAYGGGPVKVAPDAWAALHERAGVPVPEVRQDVRDASSGALSVAVVADRQVLSDVLSSLSAADPGDRDVSVRGALELQVPGEALDRYAQRRGAGMEDGQALAEVREEFAPERLGDMARVGVQLAEEPVMREFLERPELREAYAAAYDPDQAPGPQQRAVGRAVDGMLEVLDDGEPGRFEREYAAAVRVASERDGAARDLGGLDQNELRSVADRLAPEVGAALEDVRKWNAPDGSLELPAYPTKAGLDVSSSTAAGLVDELLDRAGVDDRDSRRERDRALADQHEANRLIAAADRADSRGEPEAGAAIDWAARGMYDSVERRQEVASALDGRADQETIEAWMVADANQARPAGKAVTAEPGKAPKARPARGQAAGRDHSKQIQR